MQIHEAVAKLLAAGQSEETAQDLVVSALQACQADGWHSFESWAGSKIGPKMTKAEATRIFDAASINPDDIELPSWYDN